MPTVEIKSDGVARMVAEQTLNGRGRVVSARLVVYRGDEELYAGDDTAGNAEAAAAAWDQATAGAKPKRKKASK